MAARWSGCSTSNEAGRIASWPGHIAPGSTTDHVSAFWDLLPTFSELAGAPVPPDTDGISFVPVLLGDDESQREHELLYWEFPSYGGQQAVRMGRWKGIRRNILDEGNTTIELCDLETDLEEHDVADEHPDVVAQIEVAMGREHTPSPVERFRFEALGDGAAPTGAPPSP